MEAPKVRVVVFEAAVAEVDAQSLFLDCLSCPLVDAGLDVALGADPSDATLGDLVVRSCPADGVVDVVHMETALHAQA